MMVITMVIILSYLMFQKKMMPFVAKAQTPQRHLRQNEIEVSQVNKMSRLNNVICTSAKQWLPNLWGFILIVLWFYFVFLMSASPIKCSS